ncbi:MAG: hypothetical protein KatS3mg110_1179 [Pirellulaceae bacterium]|nr:MAG: hypothetical protein KatS3mg110_1179 [Pirellulaceae bacterium]
MARRSSAGQLRRFFSESGTPLALFSPDRQLLWCNTALARWCGVSAEDLLGAATGSGNSQQLAHAVVRALSPSAEAYEGRAQRRWLDIPSALGSRSVWVSWCPMEWETTGRFSVLVVVEPQARSSDELPAMSEDELRRCHQALSQTRRAVADWLQPDWLVGDSPQIERLRTQLDLAISALARVVIVGRCGSQSHELAKYVYTRQTPATAWPLVPLECRLLDAELLTTTVVSYVRSHWQWSDPERVVLLLMDVDRLSHDAQWALWELLQRPRPRWHTLCTAEHSLLALADRGQFRSDLACYLSSVVLEIPRLQQRVEDLPCLVQRVLESQAAHLPQPVRGVSPDALEKLQHYSWPGEWEQFESLVLEAARRCQSGQIELHDLPPVLTHAEQALAASGTAKRPEPVQLDRLLEQYEGMILRRALRLARGNRARAARLVGISRARLLRRIEQLGLQPDNASDSSGTDGSAEST